MQNENTKLKQYLLGNLTAREIEEIDLRIIEDANLEEQLYYAESELMEDFLDETLLPSEMQSFRKIFSFVMNEKKSQANRAAENLRAECGDWERFFKIAGKHFDEFFRLAQAFFRFKIKSRRRVCYFAFRAGTGFLYQRG